MPQCAFEGCGKLSAGRSSYCRKHRAKAFAQFRLMLAKQAEEREQRKEQHQTLYVAAIDAGTWAKDATKPGEAEVLSVSASARRTLRSPDGLRRSMPTIGLCDQSTEAGD